MANIPTVPGSSRVQDVSIGAKRNLGAEEAPLQAARGAVSSANQAIQSGVEAVEDYELRKRRAEEAAFQNKMAVQLMNVTQDFRHNIKQQKDDQIVPNWTQVATNTRDSIISDPDYEKMTPRAKAATQQNLNLWQAQSTGEFQVIGDKLGSERRTATAIAASDAFALTGDPALRPNAVASINLAVKSGDMTKEEGDMRIAMLDYKFKAGEVANLITYDPKRAFELLSDPKKNYPQITNPDTILTLKQKAKRQWDENMSAGYGQVRKAQDDGHTWTKPELQNMADGGHLDQKSIDPILKQQAGKVKTEDVTINTGKVHDMILRINPDASPDERLEAVTKIHGSPEYLSLPNPVKKDFDEALKERSKKEKPKPNPVAEGVFQRMKEDREKNGLTIPLTGETVPGESHLFSKNGPDTVRTGHLAGGLTALQNISDDDIKTYFGDKVKKADLIQAEQMHYSQQVAKMRAWFAVPKNAEKGDDEAEAYRQSLERPYAMAATRAALDRTRQKIRDAMEGKAATPGKDPATGLPESDFER